MESRKLRPIYDAIDSKNYKNALKLCNALLQKKADSQIGKVLKALVLEKLHKRDEAKPLLAEVHATQPTDEAVLNTMALVYKSMGELDKAGGVFESAYESDPNNEDLAQAVFFSSVRQLQFSKQQLFAMKLFKNFKRDRYLFWAISSIFLQVKEKGTSTPIVLAERMTQKLIDDKKLSVADELQLYLMILEQQEKYDVAINVLQGDLGKLYKDEVEKRRQLASYYKKTGKWDQVTDINKDLVQNFDNDDWSHYQGYLEGLLKQNSNIEEAAKVASELATQMQEKDPHKRGPKLFEILVQSTLLSHGKGSIEKLRQLLISYFIKFGSKRVSVGDIRLFLHHLVDDQKDLFLKDLHSALPPFDETKAVQFIHLYSTEQKIRQILGANDNLSESEVHALVSELVDWYLKTQKYSSELEETEIGHGDDLVLLSAHILEALYLRTGNTDELVYAISLLEHGLSKSKWNAQIKILLTHLYGRMGLYEAAHGSLYRTMEIKYVQLDSLSYLFLTASVRSGCFNVEKELHEGVLKFQNDSKKEMPELLIGPYRHGSFAKLKEFVDFKRRLDESYQIFASQIDIKFVNLMTLDQSVVNRKDTILSLYAKHPINAEDLEEGKIQELSNNRDYQVVERWESAKKPENYWATILDHSLEIKWLIVKAWTLLVLQRALSLSDNLTGFLEMIPKLESVIQNFSAALEKVQGDRRPFPEPAGFTVKLLKDYFTKTVSALGAFAKLVNPGDSQDLPLTTQTVGDQIKSIASSFSELRETLKTHLKIALGVKCKIPVNTLFFGGVSFFLTFVVIETCLIQQFASILEPHRPKGKKKPTAHISQLMDLIKELTASHRTGLEDLLSIFSSMTPELNPSNFEIFASSVPNFLSHDELKKIVKATNENEWKYVSYSIEEFRKVVQHEINLVKKPNFI